MVIVLRCLDCGHKGEASTFNINDELQDVCPECESTDVDVLSQVRDI